MLADRAHCSIAELAPATRPLFRRVTCPARSVTHPQAPLFLVHQLSHRARSPGFSPQLASPHQVALKLRWHGPRQSHVLIVLWRKLDSMWSEFVKVAMHSTGRMSVDFLGGTRSDAGVGHLLLAIWGYPIAVALVALWLLPFCGKNSASRFLMPEQVFIFAQRHYVLQ